MQNHEGIGNGDKRHFNILSLDTILYFVLFHQKFKLGKLSLIKVYAKKSLSPPHFFHCQSSPPETLTQCAEAMENFFVGNSPNGEPVKNKNTMDESVMMKLLVLILMCVFFCDEF